jgi:hypothetical protein
MKVSVLKTMSDFCGNPIAHPNGQIATFRSIVCECLNYPFQFDHGKPKIHFMFLYELGKRIHDNDEVELSKLEVATIVERVTASGFYVTIKNTVYEMLDQPHIHMKLVSEMN